MTDHACQPPTADGIRHGASWRCPTCRALHIYLDCKTTDQTRLRRWLNRGVTA